MRYVAMSAALLALASPTLALASVPRLPSAVRIECNGGVGSGARYAPDKVLTAAHVALVGGCRVDGVEVSLVYVDGPLDVAVIRVTPGPVTHSILCEPMKRGRKYRGTGYADARSEAITQAMTFTGLVSADPRQPEFDGLAKFKGFSRPGMSGGPIADRKNRLVAIVNTYAPNGAERVLGRAVADTMLCGVDA